MRRWTCNVAVKAVSVQCRSSDGQIWIFFSFHEKECWSVLIYHGSLYAYLACALDIRILASAQLCCSVHQRIQQIQQWDEFQYFCLRFSWTLKDAAFPVMAIGWQYWALSIEPEGDAALWFLVAHKEISSLLCNYLQPKNLAWIWIKRFST